MPQLRNFRVNLFDVLLSLVRRSDLRLIVCGALLGMVQLVLVAPSEASPPDMATLGTAKPSAVEGLPVPVGSRLVSNAGSHYADYEVLGTLAEVDNWYKTQLPAGKPWGSWAVCQLPKPPEADRHVHGIQRQWWDGTSTLLLQTLSVHTYLNQVQITMSEVPNAAGGTKLIPPFNNAAC